MDIDNILRRLRGALGNALVRGVGWVTAGVALLATLRVAGVFPTLVGCASESVGGCGGLVHASLPPDDEPAFRGRTGNVGTRPR